MRLQAAAGEGLGQRPGPFVDLDLQPAGAPGQLVQAAARHHLPGGEDDGGVAGPFHLLQQVRREHDVHPELRADAPDQGQHLVTLERVEPVGRLVQQQQRRVVGQGGGQLDPLALTGRHGADRPLALLTEAHQPQGVAGPAHRLSPGKAVDLGQVADEVGRPGVGVEGVVLGDVAQPLPHLGAGVGRVEAEHLQGTLVGALEPEHEPEQRGLARPVGAEQPGDAPPHLQAGAVQGGGA